MGWRLINDRQLFGYLSSLVLGGVVGWGGILTSCLSAFHTYLPHGRHCLLGGVRRGGVGWDINVMSTCVSHVLAPWSSLPVGWGKEGWGGVG